MANAARDVLFLKTQPAFDKLIAPSQQVLWWEESLGAWAALHRPSYYSGQQGAGLLFNRETALEHLRRGRVVGSIQLQRDTCDVMSALAIGPKDDTPCWPTMPAIEQVCGAERGPDFIVLDRRLERGAIAQWTPDLVSGPDPTYYLHDCKQIR